ncbi:MAG: helix-turn-helix domain-containing protein [Bacteroidota bacterium]
MEVSRELLFFFSALGAFNGLVLGAYFLFFAKPKHQSHLFLGALLLALSIRVGKSVFYYFNPDLAVVYIQTGLIACWFIGPLLYFYTFTATRPKASYKRSFGFHMLFLIPAALVLFAGFPRTEYLKLWINVFIYIIYLQWLIYLIASGWLLGNVFKGMKPQMIKRGSFELWILSIFLGNLLVWIAFNTVGYTSYILGSICFTFIFYLLVTLLFSAKKKNQLLFRYPPKYGDKSISPDEASRLIKMLDDLMTGEQLYKNPNVTLPEVAKRLNTSPHRLSQLLNEHLGINFPNYLNKFRILEATTLIKDKPSFSLEAIAYDCGFNSKSAFYNAFKKETGTTPSRFK